jgi:hypothetical protein
VKRHSSRIAKITDWALFILTLLTFFDLVMTILWVASGEATEANPVMDFFLQRSFCLFVIAKLFLTFGGILILDRYKIVADKFIFKASLFLVLIYALLTGWHIIGAFATLT